MIRNKLTTILAVTTMVTMIQTAQAAFTDTLADLASSGGSLTIGDKTFSGFSFQESGLTSFNAANIIVTASQVGGNYYLTWGGNMSLASASGGGPVTADLLLNYTVAANPGVIVAIDQNYTGSAQPTPGTYISVVETATVPGGNGTIVASSRLNQAITSTSFTAVGAILNPNRCLLRNSCYRNRHQ